MAELTYFEARTRALGDLMRVDERVYVMGGHIGRPSSPALGVPEEFAHRTRRMPIGELGYAGAAIGMAAAGMRPIVTWLVASYMYQAWAQVCNEAPNYHYQTGGQTRVPVVFHMNTGIREHCGAQHNHSPAAMFWNTPGLEIVMPSTPADIAGLLPSVIGSNSPTMLLEHHHLAKIRGEVPDTVPVIPLGKGDVKRKGKDVTIVAFSIMVHRALEAAQTLAARGIDVEVVDPRCLVPLDKACILESVAKTGRLVIADECHRSGGVGAGLASIVAEDGFHFLRAPIRIVATEDTPIPFSPELEAFVTPTAEKIVAAVEGLMKVR